VPSFEEKTYPLPQGKSNLSNLRYGRDLPAPSPERSTHDIPLSDFEDWMKSPVADLLEMEHLNSIANDIERFLNKQFIPLERMGYNVFALITSPDIYSLLRMSGIITGYNKLRCSYYRDTEVPCIRLCMTIPGSGTSQ